jgi:ERCC4-type nuclease
MRLIIDNREQSLYEKCEMMISVNPGYATIENDVLPLGDILMKTDEGKDVMIIERKTLQDLLSSIKDGRYEEQSHRLKNASGFPSHNVVYIIEGMFSTLRTVMEKKLVISAMSSLNYFKGFSVMRTVSVQETAEVLLYMAEKIDKNFMKGILPSYLIREPATNEAAQIDETTIAEKSYSAFVKKVKKENITEENIGEIMLCQIPGISSIYAKSILESFKGFSNMVNEIKNGTAQFENIFYETNGKKRKIPKSCGESILKYVSKL